VDASGQDSPPDALGFRRGTNESRSIDEVKQPRSRDEAGKQQTLLAEREKKRRKHFSGIEVAQQENRAFRRRNRLSSTTQAALEARNSRGANKPRILKSALQNSSEETPSVREKLAAPWKPSKKRRRQEAVALSADSNEMARSNQFVLNEKATPSWPSVDRSPRLKQRAATQQASKMQEQVKVEREEKASWPKA